MLDRLPSRVEKWGGSNEVFENRGSIRIFSDDLS